MRCNASKSNRIAAKFSISSHHVAWPIGQYGASMGLIYVHYLTHYAALGPLLLVPSDPTCPILDAAGGTTWWKKEDRRK